MPWKSSRLLATLALLGIGIGVAGWMWWRGRKPVAISPDQMRYPCLRIIDASMWDRIDKPDDLNHLSSNRLLSSQTDPWVIDSEFRVFRMTKLAMKTNPLWLMISGPRRVEIEYELVACRDRSTEDAKTLLREVLANKPSFKDDWREAIPRAQTLKDFIELLELPVPLSGPH